MKKKIFYTFIGLLIILLLLYLVRYKTADNYANRIPKQTNAIVCVNIRQLEHHFLMDAIKHPTSYFGTPEKSKKDSLKITKKKSPSILKILEIPKSILFYANEKSIDKTWRSDLLKIKNKKLLIDFLKYHNFELVNDKNIKIYQKKAVTIILKNDVAIIALNTNKSFSEFDAWFNQTQFLGKKSTLYNKLINTNDDLFYITDKETINIQFKNGIITGKGIGNFNLFTNNKQEFFNKTIGDFSVSINKENSFVKKYFNQINKEKFRNNFKLNIDSLFTKWNGDLQCNLFDFKLKSDTIKTYEYDDDFNKIEKIAIQKTSVPEFKISLNNSNNNLSDYLTTQKAIQFINNDTIFVAFPLTKVLVNRNNNKLNFINNSKNNTSEKTIQNKFKLKIDFEKYREKTKNTPFSYFNGIKNLKKCDISISNENKLNFKIEMMDKNRNAFVQLFNLK